MADRILVTGGTGFLGRIIIEKLLEQNYKDISVISSQLVEDINKMSGVAYHHCDITDVVELSQYVESADIVIHAAGFISYQKQDVKKLQNVNSRGTENVANLCIHHKPRKVVHISSIAAIPNHPLRKLISEKDRFNDRNFSSNYGMTKYIGESHMWRARAEGVDVCVLNPSLIIGIGDWQKGTPNFFQKIDQGLKYYPSGGNGIVYANDIADFIIWILKGKAEEDQYILSGENVMFKHLFDLIADSLSIPKPTLEIKGMLKYAARVVDLLQSTIYNHPRYLSKESLANISEVKRFDNSLSLTVEGFEYTDIKLAVQNISEAYLKDKM